MIKFLQVDVKKLFLPANFKKFLRGRVIGT